MAKECHMRNGTLENMRVWFHHSPDCSGVQGLRDLQGSTGLSFQACAAVWASG